MEQLNFTYQKEIKEKTEIYIGKGASNQLAELLQPLNPDKVFIICDTIIDRLYAPQIKDTLSGSYETHIIVHEPNEANKKLEAIVKMSNEFFSLGGTAKSCICAVGGGITGNMAGFFASIAYRGIPLIHVPTSLLAQVDSAVGIEQSASSPTAKNSLGSYMAPTLVVIDPALLETLPEREIRAGLGEAIKHGFSQDMSLVDYIVSFDFRNLDELETLIKRTLKLKLEHWNDTPDIWDTSRKVVRLTYLGHTTAKALEVIDTDYLTHGEAISHGMVIEAYASHKMGLLDVSEVDSIKSNLEKIQLLQPLSKKYSVEKVLSKLYVGKNEPIFALLKKLGNPDTLSQTIPKQIMQEALQWYMKTSLK
jgi:3-dehydroquinate synthase